MSRSKTLSFKLHSYKSVKNWPIVALFSVLPIIDTLNGLFLQLPLGVLYKLGLCGLLFVVAIIKGRFKKKYIYIMLFSALYISFSIIVNIVLGFKLINSDYPIKLIFNIVLYCLLMNELQTNRMNGDSIYHILNNSSWLLIACFLFPYLLGVGNRVYGNEMGYKAFFISQNELALIISVLVFFSAYKLIYRINIRNVINIALLFLCGILLNTKTTIITCILAIGMWILPIIARSKFKVKLSAVLVMIIGLFVFRNRLIMAISNSYDRYSLLLTRHYEGSALTGVLSARNYYLKDALENLNGSHTVLRGVIGNGFCSDILVEMDLCDIFFYLGTVGLIATIVFLFIIFKKSCKMSKKDNSLIRPVSFVTIVALLTLAGHVLFMSMSGCFFVLYVCFLTMYERNPKNEKKNNPEISKDNESILFREKNNVRNQPSFN